MTVLTRDEFGLPPAKLSAHYQPLVLMLVATGLRWGKAAADAAVRALAGLTLVGPDSAPASDRSTPTPKGSPRLGHRQ